MAEIRLKHVSRKLSNGVAALKDIDLEIKEREFVVITGDDECGKSVLLRIIAGLEDPDAGDILIDGVNVNGVEARDRKLSMLLENSILYPDMTVYENLIFSLKLRHWPKARMEEAAQKTAKLLGLERIMNLKPDSLTPLQIHNVVLGRCLVRGENLILLEEPLVDVAKEDDEYLWKQLITLQEKLKLTIVMITSKPEAIRMISKRTVIMHAGEIVQNDIPENLYRKPSCAAAAKSLYGDSCKLFPAKCRKENGNMVLQFEDGTVIPDTEIYPKIVNYDKKEVLAAVCDDKLYIFDPATERAV